MVMASPEDDDLTVIDGIGPARSEWLRASLGVTSYARLAALSADELVAALKAGGQVASRRIVEPWLEQARQLAAAAENADWVPLASFVVEFQGRKTTGALRTVVHHVEADDDEMWPGVEPRRASDWMLERAPESNLANVNAPPAPRLTVGPIRVRRRDTADTEVAAAASTGGAMAPGLRHDEPFALEIPVDVAPGQRHLGRRDYRIRLYAHELRTEGLIDLGDATTSVAPHELPSAATLANCQLPTGVYRLRAVAYEDDRVTPSALDAPLLRIR
jgi:hypothetical protein